ncbi:alpha-amylase family glycosyl hydrolase [Ancylomarina longa]|uniref:Alpha-amylase n=1 Tax=Ancylomarina longa TaxID=2487017 RepID=A0A434AZD5_9BACT|nr:alpha-amylase family glycosyl hydrolase [Ancylomarina longa]RUT79960.1 alpha-amylase [Ancylomarina longa]
MEKTKIVIYQLFVRLFGNRNTNPIVNGNKEENGSGKFSDISHLALKEIKQLGINHIWYTGIIEHAITEGYPDLAIPNGNPLVIKGKAGSPYAIKDYYDVNPDLANNVEERMQEFEALIQRTHENDLKVIIDFVPNHLSREYHSDKKPEGVEDFGATDDTDITFTPSNNFYYLPNQELQLAAAIQNRFPDTHYHEYPAKATGNDLFTAYPKLNDWYETIKLNYGVDYQNENASHFHPTPNTWIKMKDILLYWARKGVDGFRCDMAEMVPVEFWEWVIPEVKQEFPEILFIAEVYNPSLYDSYIHKGKFDYLYDKVGLYDTLRGIIQGEQSAKEITNCWQSLNGLDPYMLRFLENHDEQRITSRFFAGDAWKALPGMTVSVCLHQGPAMLYFGQEVGEAALGASGFSGDNGRTTIFDYWNVPEHQKWMNNGKFDGDSLSQDQKELRKAYADILHLAKQPAIAKGAFYDVMWVNSDKKLFNFDKAYAFLRHCEVQKLLIVCNFDSQSQEVHLKIPSHALEIMNIPRPISITLQNLQNSLAVNTDSEQLTEEGVKLKLKTYESLVLEIII